MQKRIFYLLGLTLAIVCFSKGMYAQDVLVFKNGDRKEVNIVEVKTDQIKYYEWGDEGQLLFTLDRAQLREIIFESGTRSAEGEDPLLNENYYVDDKSNNLKINFTAFSDATTIFTFERMINPHSSWEVDLRINGLGVNNDHEESGFGIAAAYKVKLKSVLRRNGYRPKHLLHGGYLRGRLGYNYSEFGDGDYDFSDVSYAHFGLDIGQQWILNNVISLDIYFGFHYFGGTFNERPGQDFLFANQVDEGDLFGNNETALSVGIRVGILL